MEESIQQRRIEMLEHTVKAFLRAKDAWNEAEALARQYGEFLTSQAAQKPLAQETMVGAFSGMLERLARLEAAIVGK